MFCAGGRTSVFAPTAMGCRDLVQKCLHLDDPETVMDWVRLDREVERRLRVAAELGGEKPKIPSKTSTPKKAAAPKTPRVDAAKRSRCWEKGLCLGCGGQVHFLIQCPSKKLSPTSGEKPPKLWPRPPSYPRWPPSERRPPRRLPVRCSPPSANQQRLSPLRQRGGGGQCLGGAVGKRGRPAVREPGQQVLCRERCLEDHELVAQVESMMGGESKFLFRKNYAKYEFFKNPVNFFPEQMVAWCQQSNGCIPRSQLLQNFLNSSSCPEIQGFLHVKELGRKSWKKLYVCLRRSGLYCSTKGSSKEPRHLQLLADLEDSNIFSLIAGKKMYSAPTDYGFCIKPNRVRNEAKELRLLCVEDEQGRSCWMTAFRLLKYGMLLYQNYRIPQQRKAMLPHFTTPVRSVSENSLVAMDFSGQIGRVIENPAEAQCAALEEGYTWRKRSTRMNSLSSQSPLHPSTLSTVIHRTQPWFHGRISREESHRIVKQQGLVDGLFLLRDSQSNPKTFVLTLCHHQKIKHFQILPCEEDGQMFFSLDDGNTKFTDLIQLVEFYQLNKGILPCKLKHPCIRVAL
ncbi:growth factor receptor-bound protein 10 isoform X4 [Paroedura picta]|uniref:growth factor receptor-bound protein 10 isoform X4 n=1 Tax=Paroedura picta TaxID=143630 RepID=UPI004057A0D3